MDSCKHVGKVSPAMDNTLLNPQKWACNICGTTESVWACLTCSNVACGRYIKEHAYKHYTDTTHPIVLEVNELFAFCYECDDYILNDNKTGDIRLLREILSVVVNQRFTPNTGGARALRRRAEDGTVVVEDGITADQIQSVVVKFRRVSTIAKAFSAWRDYVRDTRSVSARQMASRGRTSRSSGSSQASGSSTMKRPLSPTDYQPAKKPRVSSVDNRPFQLGVTGLRNLGNTCYMNSVLQILSNLDDFREYFLAISCPVRPMDELTDAELAVTPEYQRQTTTECLKKVSEPRRRLRSSSSESDLSSAVRSTSDDVQQPIDSVGSSSLAEEVYALFRVMWSGKMSIVIPHGFLHAVWDRVPTFKGHQQQDAQEFLCEMLEKLADELLSQAERPESVGDVSERRSSSVESGTSSRSLSRSASVALLSNVTPPPTDQQRATAVQNLIRSLFNGKLRSEVTCLKCGRTSVTMEPFSDLSLEFPEQFQQKRLTMPTECDVKEMLTAFTTEEELGSVYTCTTCNAHGTRVPLKTNAKKRILLKQLPKILRLHLKRFRWSSDRNNRDKISSHVQFDEFLDMRPYCFDGDWETSYRLCGVINHSGRGFNTGHYTSYCWNSKGGFWLYCNDARLQVCALDDVLRSQAYILFYTRYHEQTEKVSSPFLSQDERDVDEHDRRKLRSTIK